MGWSDVRGYGFSAVQQNEIWHRWRQGQSLSSIARDPLYEALEDGRSRRIRGIAATSLLVALQLAHANARKIASWLLTLPRRGQPAQRRAGGRQAKKPPELWTPAGYIDPTELAA